MAFLNSAHREAPENVIKKIEKKSVLDFSTRCFAKLFCSAFELPSLRNTPNRDKTKKVEEKLTSKFLSIFLGKVFDMDFLQKFVCGVFEVLLPSNAQKTY
jgi:hypothetical protein